MRSRPNRPGYVIQFKIAEFLCRYKSRIATGQTLWPTAHYIRTNLYSPEQNWSADTRGALTDAVTADSKGSNPRTNLFQKQLEVLLGMGWLESFDDDQGRKRYKITDVGEDGYQKLGQAFLRYAESASRVLMRRTGERKEG